MKSILSVGNVVISLFRFIFVTHKYALIALVLLLGIVVCFLVVFNLFWENTPMAYPKAREPLMLSVSFCFYFFIISFLDHIRSADAVIPYEEDIGKALDK